MEAMVNLNAVEQRVVGALMEKEMTTPEYYPLSLNALINACNQKSSREPVMELGETDVRTALFDLEQMQLQLRLRAEHLTARDSKYQLVSDLPSRTRHRYLEPLLHATSDKDCSLPASHEFGSALPDIPPMSSLRHARMHASTRAPGRPGEWGPPMRDFVRPRPIT